MSILELNSLLQNLTMECFLSLSCNGNVCFTVHHLTIPLQPSFNHNENTLIALVLDSHVDVSFTILKSQ